MKNSGIMEAGESWNLLLPRISGKKHIVVKIRFSVVTTQKTQG